MIKLDYESRSYSAIQRLYKYKSRNKTHFFGINILAALVTKRTLRRKRERKEKKEDLLKIEPKKSTGSKKKAK